MSTTPQSNKSKKRSTRNTIEQKRDNTLVKIKSDLLKELRDKLKTEYQLEGKLNLAQIELAWGDLKEAKKIRRPEPPSQQTLQNFLNKETKKEYWLIDGLCQLLLGYSFEEWKEQHKQTQEVSQEKSLYEDELRKQQAEIAEIKLLNSQFQSLLLSHNQLGALVTAVKAGKKSQEIRVPGDIKMQTVCNLWEVLYKIRERNRFYGHSDEVDSVSFSPDGQMIASTSKDEIMLWRKDGRRLKTTPRQKGSITSICFSPNGKMIAFADSDYTVKFWLLDDHEIQTFPKEHSKEVYSICFSPNGEMIASASADGTVKLWNLWGEVVHDIEESPYSVRIVSFSPDGETLVSVERGDRVKLWSLPYDGAKPKILEGTLNRDTYFDNIFSLSPNGKMFASASEGTLRIWELFDDAIKLAHTIQEADIVRVRSASFSRDSKMIAWVNSNGELKIGNSKNQQIFQGNSTWRNSISFSEDNRTIAVAGCDNTVKLWSLDGEKVTRSEEGEFEASSACFSPDLQLLVIVSTDNKVTLLHRDDTPNQNFPVDTGVVYDVSFSQIRKMIALANENGKVALWHLDGTHERTITVHTGIVYSVSFSLDGEMIASANDDGIVKVWNINDGKKLKAFSMDHPGQYSISFHPDGNRIAAVDIDGIVKLWNIKNPEECQTFQVKHPSNEVVKHSFSPDGQIIASASNDGIVKLFNLEGQELRTFDTNTNIDFFSNVNCVSFGNDGKLAFSNRYGKKENARSEGISYYTEPTLFGTDIRVIEWNLNLEDLLKRGCDWLHDYLKNNPNVSASDRLLCD